MMDSPFKESLLVPASFLIKKKEKLQLKKKITPTAILTDTRRPADLRLKYFDNFVKFNKEREKSPLKVITKTEQEAAEKVPVEDDPKVLLKDIPKEKIPLATSILSFIKDSDEISWNQKFEVIIDGNTIQDSDIRKIIQYYVGEIIVTDARHDVPIGANILKEKLEIIDIPFTWFKLIPRRSSRGQKEQTGKGRRWFVY